MPYSICPKCRIKYQSAGICKQCNYDALDDLYSRLFYSGDYAKSLAIMERINYYRSERAMINEKLKLPED